MRNRTIIIILSLIISAFAINQSRPIVAADGIPKGWFKTGSHPQNYEMVIDTVVKHSGKASGHIRFIADKAEGFATLAQVFKADDYRGKRVRMSAWLKAEDAEAAELWLRVDSARAMLGLDNMTNRPMKGTGEWTKYELTLDVPAAAVDIAFGTVVVGKGQAWADDFRFEAVGTEVPSTNVLTPEQMKDELQADRVTGFASQPVNLDFEEGVLTPEENSARFAREKADADAFSVWLAANAIKLDTVQAGHGFADMQPLKKVVGDARIVALGEATHGTREFFQLKHRMMEFLANEKGFTIFSIEANMPEAYRLNDFVLNGKGDPAKLIRGMYFWTSDTQEVLDMVLWMREFNKSGKGPVQFTGFDMQTPNVARDIVNDFVASNDAEYATTFHKASDMVNAGSEAQGPTFGVATATFPIQAAAGKRIRYSGYIKTEGITRGWAGLWWRVDGSSGVLAFDNMQDRGVSGTTDWKRYEINLPVAADAKNINFGALHAGDGSVWFDGLAVEVDGVPYSDTSVFDLDFEAPTPVGFFTGGKGYEVRLDKNVFHSGKQSLRMLIPPPNIGGGDRVLGGTGDNKIFTGKEVSQKPRILSKPEPNSTDAARKNHTSGTVLLQSVFTAGGQVAQIRVLKGLPDGLSEEAIAAAKRIKFEPAMKDGKAVSMYMHLQYDFNQPGDSDDPVTTWQGVVRHLEESRTAYAKKKLSAQEIEWAIQNARVVLQCFQMRANKVSRDQSMADNIKWILDQNPGAKIVLWAHNGHVATASGGGYDPMGVSLRKMYGDNMVVFGFAFNQGSFQARDQGKGLHDFTVPPAPAGSLDATFGATGIPLFAVDLRAAPRSGPVANWLGESHKTRSIGALFSQDADAQYQFDMKASQSFDVILFVEKTTAARKNP